MSDCLEKFTVLDDDEPSESTEREEASRSTAAGATFADLSGLRESGSGHVLLSGSASLAGSLNFAPGAGDAGTEWITPPNNMRPASAPVQRPVQSGVRSQSDDLQLAPSAFAITQHTPHTERVYRP